MKRRGEPVKVNLKIGEAPPPLEAESVRIRIGAVVYPLSAYVARRLGVPTDFGIFVHKVEPDTPADAIGLKADDVIISWAGERLGSVSRLASRLDSTLPGSRVTIDVLRGDLPLEAVLQVK